MAEIQDKIKKVLAAQDKLAAAAKAGAKALNELSGGAYEGTGLLDQASERIGEVVALLNRAKAELDEQAQYDGLTENEVADKKAQERADEIAALQAAAAAHLDAVLNRSLVAEPQEEPTEPTYQALVTEVKDRLPE